MSNPSTIKVFFDTNVIHTAQAHLLLPKAVVEYIKDHKRIESVDIVWCVPEFVIEERRHQMQRAANALLPKLEDLEKVIGHSLAITPDILNDRIDAKIAAFVEEYGLNVVNLDEDKVDINDLTRRSAHRLPPFETSDKSEKGFRDSIIATTFLQEVEASPSTPRVCRLVFVTGDKRLQEYLREKTETTKNTRLLESLDELRSLLNAIASEVTEEFLTEISSQAESIFYNFEKQAGLYVSEKVYKEIGIQFEEELSSVTEHYPNSIREADRVSLGDLTFMDKKGQIVHWTTEVVLRFKVSEVSNSLAALIAKTAQSEFGQNQRKILATGRSRFLVHWQLQVTTRMNILKPKINKISFVQHEFDAEEVA